MAIISLDPTGKGQACWTMRWKTALVAFDITYANTILVHLMGTIFISAGCIGVLLFAIACPLTAVGGINGSASTIVGAPWCSVDAHAPGIGATTGGWAA
ncbi:hypothetical protein [Streptomyces sp. NRRL F-5126]|uniref:hypothetical protein n=1 Tax=Streptomyces sp. NRRL F-5126 TaxID=1463857 RepID=UPI0004C69D10|nr:hypothetical protein [Streptomyces sp. NRRL F-5126]